MRRRALAVAVLLASCSDGAPLSMPDADSAPVSPVDSGADTVGPGPSDGGVIDQAPDGTSRRPAEGVISPMAQTFSGTVGSAGAALTFRVANVGDEPTGPLTATLGGTDAADFLVTGGTCGEMLPPAGSCTVLVAFKPHSAGMKAATLTVTASVGGSVTAMLTGVALPPTSSPAFLVISPAQQSFGGLAGMVGAPVTFTVANAGETPTGPLTVALGGTDAASFVIAPGACPTPLPAKGTCEVKVSFKPPTAGDRAATLTASASPGGMAVAQLQGSALAIDEWLISPASVDFGAVPVGTTSPALVFQVQSDFHEPIGPLQVSTTSPEFVVKGGTCMTAVVPPYATCTVEVAFAPTTPGRKEAMLTVAGSIPGMTVSGLLRGTTP